MAKKKEQADQSPEDSAVGDVLEQSTAAVIDVPVSVPAAKWRVTLSSSTPVQFPSLEVAADSESDAKAAFDKANGINGSDHPYTFEKV